MNHTISKENAIRAIVSSCIKSYVSGFSDRHPGEDNDEGDIRHNTYVPILDTSFAYSTDLNIELGAAFDAMLRHAATCIAALTQGVTSDTPASPCHYWNEACRSDKGYAIVLDEFLHVANGIRL